jgi:NitT/TauT family transport system permease protein
MKRFVLPLLPLVVILYSLEILVRTGILPQFLCPAPSSVFEAIGEAPGEFLEGFLQTTLAAGLGLGLSVLIGLGAALALTYSPWLRRVFYPYAIFFQTVPIIAIAPILVIWLGYGLPTVVASSFIVAVFPIIANSVMGLLSTPVEWVNLFQLMGAGRYQKLFQLRLPAALPAILGGVKISAGLSVIGAIVGEFISGTGLGGIVDAARNQQRVDRVFAAVGLAAVLGLMFFAVVSLSNAYLLRHRDMKE